LKINSRLLWSGVLALVFAILACTFPGYFPLITGAAATEYALTSAAQEIFYNQTAAVVQALNATQQAANLNTTATQIYAEGTSLAARYATITATTTPNPTSVTAGPVLVNPGFEDGIDGWTDINSTCNSRSDADNTEAHSGTQSRKLYLRYCGSYITQHVIGSLPTGSSLTLKAWVKMPFAGDKANKYFTLNLVLGSASGQTSKVSLDQFDAISDWTQLTVGPVVATFPVAWVEVIAETDKGGGNNTGYDKPVWVDDFELVTQAP